jgi:ABC-type molybdate transport system substrate-binding protein
MVYACICSGEGELGVTAGIGAGSKSPDAVKELLKFLTGSDAAARFKANGFEPG